MTEKVKIQRGTVQETLIIPLFGRLICSEHFPDLFTDPEAKRICASLDYNFAEKRKKMESPTLKPDLVISALNPVAHTTTLGDLFNFSELAISS